jgi:hypothetical protein
MSKHFLYFFNFGKNRIQSNLSTTATLGTPKKRPLFRGGRYSEFSPIKLQLVWDVWGSGWPLLTGGRCSEVAVNTGLTVVALLIVHLKERFFPKYRRREPFEISISQHSFVPISHF